MFPDMCEKTVISIVLQILKTITDGDLLDSQRCVMLDSSLILFTTIPPTTGYHSVRIFIPLPLNKTTIQSLLNKNAVLDLGNSRSYL